MFGVGVTFIGLGVLGLIFVGLNSTPDFKDLVKVKGTITAVDVVSHRKAGQKIQMILHTDQGDVNIHTNDLQGNSGISRTLKKEDVVVAWITKDNLWRDFYWLWQLERNGSTIVSYRDQYEYEQGGRQTMLIASLSVLVLDSYS
jgi:hypothetical protein